MSKTITLLSEDDQKRLDTLETVIKENMAAFIRVGLALKEIKEKQLYIATAETFPQYVKRVWDMGKSRAYQLIDSAAVYENIKKTVHHGGQSLLPAPDDEDGYTIDLPVSDVPINERQTRELAALKTPDQQREAWRRVNEAHPGEVTAARLKKIVKKMRGEKVASGIEDAKGMFPKEKPMPGSSFDDGLWAAYDAFMKEIVRVSNAGWVGCSRGDLLKCMVVIHDLIEDDAFAGGR